MATPKWVSAADLVPHSKLKVTVLSPYESDGTGQVGLRLDEIPAAPTAVGVAVGVAPRHATVPLWHQPLCRLILWGLGCFFFAAALTVAIMMPEYTPIPVWLRSFCWLVTSSLCYAGIFTLESKTQLAPLPMWHRVLFKSIIWELWCICCISAALFIHGVRHLVLDGLNASELEQEEESSDSGLTDGETAGLAVDPKTAGLLLHLGFWLILILCILGDRAERCAVCSPK